MVPAPRVGLKLGLERQWTGLGCQFDERVTRGDRKTDQVDRKCQDRRRGGSLAGVGTGRGVHFSHVSV